MKTPPLLLFATLLFWGWQSHLLWEGAAAGAALEAARVLKLRWDLEDVDFNRIWSLCVLVIMVSFGYLFTTNDQGGGFSAMTQGPTAIRTVTNSSSVAATTVMRWLPLICFPFIVAQVFNVRPSVPLTAVSMVLRIRRRRGDQSLAGRYVDISYSYFIVCLFSAGIHSNQGTYTYFWGQGILILWALWTLRSGRFGLKIWALGLAVVMALGFAGGLGINGFERVVQNFDAQIFARFFGSSRTDPTQSSTSMGEIGELELSPRIVIRLQPSRLGLPPSYLREASYWTYDSKRLLWSAGGTRNPFEDVSHAAHDDTTWFLQPNKTNTLSAEITAYLNGRERESGNHEGLLPLPSGSGRLEQLPAFTLKLNRTGAVLATGPGLLIFDALYGPGTTCDFLPDTSTNQLDFLVPTNELPALNEVIGELNVSGASDADKRLAVETFFMRNFTYSTWQGRDKQATANASPLTRFLLTSRSGHCEYFATATVLLLRKLGIPARYAVGYYVHEVSGSGYVVRERDAHAWCLAWNRETQCWEDFDTTPPSWVAVEGRKASFLDTLSDLRSWLGLQFEKLFWRQANLRQYVLWTLSPVIMVLLYYIIFQRRAKARAAAKKVAAEAPVIWPGHDSAFYRLEHALATRGLPRQPPEALADWLERALAEPALVELRAPLRELLRLHYRYRFDPPGLSDAEKTSLVTNVDVALGQLAGLKPPHVVRPAA
jgi:hypothetical protein